MTHEIIMKVHLEDESKKKKSIALNTISMELEDEDGLGEDEIAYFSSGSTDFPLLKSSKKSKKKTMKAIWDDSSKSESEVEEMANLGLMAHSDKEDEHDDEKDALLDKVRFLKHDSCEKDNLIKMLKENELNVLQDLDKAKETIKKLTIGAQRLDKIIEVTLDLNALN
ncbi:uncharacterized protein E6C27_scaffold102G00500 [Cucumis melo var. makuwa]|uniref:Uncharacterized protein n=1 Tax=Cucumis melo var. makuwa TaxID=1194695 RepID=A0A5A7UFI4_CUCMM|nr:uncharacterized protein E6C27_scaffold102G00500 [Cucumis melo var. makuwa]